MRPSENFLQLRYSSTYGGEPSNGTDVRRVESKLRAVTFRISSRNHEHDSTY